MAREQQHHLSHPGSSYALTALPIVQGELGAGLRTVAERQQGATASLAQHHRNTRSRSALPIHLRAPEPVSAVDALSARQRRSTRGLIARRSAALNRHAQRLLTVQ